MSNQTELINTFAIIIVIVMLMLFFAGIALFYVIYKEKKEEALKEMSEVIYDKYGMISANEIKQLCYKLGNETVVLYLKFLATKGKVKIKTTYSS